MRACVLAALIQNFATSPFFQKLQAAVGRNAVCPSTDESLLASLAFLSRSEATLKRRKNLDRVNTSSISSTSKLLAFIPKMHPRKSETQTLKTLEDGSA